MTYHLEPMRPFIDGICYDDLDLVGGFLRPALIARGLVWETEFHMGQTAFAGSIVAANAEQAQEIAFGRGLGETVIGPYREPVKVDD